MAKTPRFAKWTITPTFMKEDRSAVEHSLCRILALANRYKLDAAEVVKLFATDHWGVNRGRFAGLAWRLSQRGFSDALQSGRTLSQQTRFFLNVANHFSLGESAWDEILEWQSPANLRESRIWKASISYWIVVGLVMLMIASLSYRTSVAIIRRMLLDEDWEEYRLIEQTNVLSMIAWLGPFLGWILPVAVCALLFLWVWKLYLGAWAVRILQRFPIARSLRNEGDTAVLRLLALTIDSNVPIRDALQFMSDSHYSPAIRFRLSRVLELTTTTGEEWTGLTKERFLTHKECVAIREAGDSRIQAWVLRRISIARREATVFQRLKIRLFGQPLTAFAFGLFVLWLAYIVFGTLNTLVHVLANGNG